MNVFIIGTGMYVAGRNTDGYGTILPAIFEWKRDDGSLDAVIMVGTDREHTLEGLKKATDLHVPHIRMLILLSFSDLL